MTEETTAPKTEAAAPVADKPAATETTEKKPEGKAAGEGRGARGGRGGGRGRGRRGGGRGRRTREPKEFEETILQIDRVTRVTRGGRQLRFRVSVVIGDRKGRVGLGIGKSSEVLGGIRKAVSMAKKNLVKVPIYGETIPHNVQSKFKASQVTLMPAQEGKGVIAGGSVRKILDLAGVKNVLSKMHGSRNPINTAKATLIALKELEQQAPPHIRNQKKQEANGEAGQGAVKAEASKPAKKKAAPKVKAEAAEKTKTAAVDKQEASAVKKSAPKKAMDKAAEKSAPEAENPTEA